MSYLSVSEALVTPERVELNERIFEIAAQMVEPFRTTSTVEYSNGDPTRHTYDGLAPGFEDHERIRPSSEAAREFILDMAIGPIKKDNYAKYFVMSQWDREVAVDSLSIQTRTLLLGRSAVRLFANLLRPLRTYVDEGAPTARNITNITLLLENDSEDDLNDPIGVFSTNNPINLYTAHPAAPSNSVVLHFDSLHHRQTGMPKLHDTSVRDALERDLQAVRLLESIKES